MYDHMFRNALIVDGSGVEPYRANVAVFGDRIAFIGKEGITRAKNVIDASDAVLAPGFIDMHTHTDLQEFSQMFPVTAASECFRIQVKPFMQLWRMCLVPMITGHGRAMRITAPF